MGDTRILARFAREFINKNFNQKTILKLNGNVEKPSDYWFKQLPKTTKKLDKLITCLISTVDETHLPSLNEALLLTKEES